MKTSKESSTGLLLDAIGRKDPSEAIYAQEKRGQQSFCNSTDLPIAGGGYGEPGVVDQKLKDQLEAMGIKTGEPYEEDPIFMSVELPEGWEKRPTDHDMWNDLVDNKGRVRANIFYKAAVYDRSSFMRLSPRFSYKKNYDDFRENEDSHKNTHIQHRVFDCDKVVFACEPEKDTRWETEPDKDLESKALTLSHEIDESQWVKCKEWLNEHYPEWEDPTKYWD